MPLVFVYGTLKRGERNHCLLAAARFVGAAVTDAAHFTLSEYPSGSTPGRRTPSAEPGGRHRLAGELFDVDAGGLARLDELERLGIDYERHEVRCGGVTAWIYLRAPASGRAAEIDPVFITIADGIAGWSEAPTRAVARP